MFANGHIFLWNFGPKNVFLNVSGTFREISTKIDFDCPTDKIARTTPMETELV